MVCLGSASEFIRSTWVAAFPTLFAAGRDRARLALDLGPHAQQVLVGAGQFLRVGRVRHLRRQAVAQLIEFVNDQALVGVLDEPWEMACLHDENIDRMAFQARADYQNQAIGWPRKGRSSHGGGTVVRFPRIWMPSGKC